MATDLIIRTVLQTRVLSRELEKSNDSGATKR